LRKEKKKSLFSPRNRQTSARKVKKACFHISREGRGERRTSLPFGKKKVIKRRFLVR